MGPWYDRFFGLDRIKALEQRATLDEAVTKAHLDRIVQLEAKMTEVETYVAQVETDYAAVKTDMTGLQTDIGAMQGSMTNLSAQIATLEAGQANLSPTDQAALTQAAADADALKNKMDAFKTSVDAVVAGLPAPPPPPVVTPVVPPATPAA